MTNQFMREWTDIESAEFESESFGSNPANRSADDTTEEERDGSEESSQSQPDYHKTLLHAGLSRAQFQGTYMGGMKLGSADLRGATLLDCDMSGAEIEGANFTGATLTGCDMSASSMSAADFTDARLADVDASNSSITGVKLDRALLTECSITSTTIRAFASHARFERVAFTGSSFYGSQLSDSVFSASDLTQVDFRECDASGVVFARCQMRKFVATSSWFTRADFSAANLSEATIHDSYMTEANFRGANLEEGSLRRCNLSFADFTGANLKGTSLEGSCLRGAILTGADLKGTTYSRDTRWPDGFTPPLEAVNMDERAAANNSAYQNQMSVSYGVYVHNPDFGGAHLHLAACVYTVYPDTFRQFHGWAYPGETARRVMGVVDRAAKALRAGDGDMPFESERDKITCVALHLGNAVSSSALLAGGEAMGAREHEKLLYESIVAEVKNARASNRRRKRSAA